MKIERKKGVKSFRIVEHNKTVLYWIIALLILLVIVICVLINLNNKEQTQIANPASVYCTSQGGKLDLINNENGSYGMCTLANGQVCEEWAYFRGECGNSNLSEDSCTVDTDCVKVQTGCCGCNMGGQEKCLNKPSVVFYQEKLKNCSKTTICPAVYGCNSDKCSCINGKCQ